MQACTTFVMPLFKHKIRWECHPRHRAYKNGCTTPPIPTTSRVFREGGLQLACLNFPTIVLTGLLAQDLAARSSGLKSFGVRTSYLNEQRSRTPLGLCFVQQEIPVPAIQTPLH
jgi:hypothetical protein